MSARSVDLNHETPSNGASPQAPSELSGPAAAVDALSSGQQSRAWASIVFCGIGVAFLLLCVLNLVGPLVQLDFPVAGLAALGAVVYGIHHYRPPRVWCWYALAISVLLYTVGGVARVEFNTLGNLTASRSLIPDVLILPAYVLLITGLLGFVFARRFFALDRGEIVLDGAIAALAVFCCAWVYLLQPVVDKGNVPFTVKLVLIGYPTMSTFLVAVAFHLQFSPGAQKNPITRFVVLMTVMILTGDIIYMLAELGHVSANSRFLAAPYVLSFIVAGGISLHPSMIELSAPRRVAAPFRSRSRLAIVAVGLAVPGALFISKEAAHGADRIIIAVTVLSLIAAAVYRIFRALELSMNSEARLSHQATHDLLTGLPNRGLVQHYIEEALGAPNPRTTHVAVLFLDLDRFKLVNDTYGHGRGDELLVEVAQRLRNAVRPGDLISRIGGDEFVMVLKDLRGADEAMILAEKIRQSLAAPFNVRGTEIYVNASIGVSLAESGQEHPEAEVLIRDADNAMYQAKGQGRSAVVLFDLSMRHEVTERLELEHDLRHAIENGELRLHYQPIVDLTNGGVDGLEALVRWHHPKLGSLSPVKFIPIAEDSGLIIEIGAWILGQACADLQRFRTELGLGNLHMSVNLSTVQMRDVHLPDAVEAALRANGIPGTALHLEITESLLMEDPLEAIKVISSLKSLDVEMSIDDFGTGYSSLAYLRQFPVDRVKIDKAFVDLLDDETRTEETLIPAIISMARALRVKTIAEGVETIDQDRALRELGCDFGQGYLYSRPVPSERTIEEIRRLEGEAEARLVRPR